MLDVLDVLEANLAELPVGVPALVESVGGHALTPLHVTVSTERGWDDCEWSRIGSVEEHAHANPEDADELRAATASHRDSYLRGYRDVLGYAAVIARRTD